jgi:hypothetical protein
MFACAAVAQLDRVLGYEPRGRGFNSCQPHQNTENQTLPGFVVTSFTSMLLMECCRSFAAVAQLDRVLGYEPRGRGFNSCQPHQYLLVSLPKRSSLRFDESFKLRAVRRSVSEFAAVAQLDRVLGYEPRGRGFNSCQPHQYQQ